MADGVPGKVSAPPASRVSGARFAPRAIALVPWFDALLLAVSAALFANATARVPGQAVSLPEEPFLAGERPSALAVAVVAAPRAEPETVGDADAPTLAAAAFLDGERYDLASAARAADFRRDLAEAAEKALETRAVAYVDGDMPHRDVVLLSALMREAGVEKVLFAVRPPAGPKR